MKPQSLIKLSGNTNYKIKINSHKQFLPYTGVNICIINKNNEAILKRLDNYVSTFNGPYMEEIDSIMVAPEQDKLNVSNIEIFINDILKYKFTYNDTIQGEPVNIMKPDLSYDNMKPIYDEEYLQFKNSIIINTVELTLLGSLLISYASSIDKGYSYTLGGTIGLLYILLLESGIDCIGKTNYIMANSAVRLSIIFSISIALVTYYKEDINQDHSVLIYSLLGFLTHRIALIKSYIKK